MNADIDLPASVEPVMHKPKRKPDWFVVGGKLSCCT